jgi:hypothetical protein
MRTRLLRPAVLALALLTGARPTLPASLFHQTVPVDTVVPDPCSGEDVHFTGTADVSANLTINDNQAHAFALVNIHLTGQGLTSGAPYLLNGTGTTTETVDNLSSTGELTILITQPVIGLGGVSDAVAQLHFHVTVNANGIVSALLSDEMLICN